MPQVPAWRPFVESNLGHDFRPHPPNRLHFLLVHRVGTLLFRQIHERARGRDQFLDRVLHLAPCRGDKSVLYAIDEMQLPILAHPNHQLVHSVRPGNDDRGRGLLYDVERDLTWLQDTNYAKTIGRTPDGQLTWDDAKAWVARLNYRGITGWRLPTALNPDGSGPCVGDNCRESELGHLVFKAFQRPSPGLRLVNWQPFSIYWSSTEDSATEAFAFKVTGLKQGRLAKNPWAVHPVLGGAVPLTDLVLTWPVYDGDVARGFLSSFDRYGPSSVSPGIDISLSRSGNTLAHGDDRDLDPGRLEQEREWHWLSFSDLMSRAFIAHFTTR